MYWVVESTLVPIRAMHPARGDAPYLIITAASTGGRRTARD